jgi:riboflavin synthase
MFTGIVEARGTVEALEPRGSVHRVVIATADLPVEELPLGASIAVDGVCLTVIERSRGRFAADLGPETLVLTTLKSLAVGGRVHLERALKLGDSLGGHLVSGHVDGVGQVVARRELGEALELRIAAPAQVAPTLVVKGSVTVDGVSLTINAVDRTDLHTDSGATFSVTLIPHTLAVTGLGEKGVGAPVNLEGDQIAKHVDRILAARLAANDAKPDTTTDTTTDTKKITPPLAPPASPRPTGLTLETLRKHGFAR